MLKTEHDKVTNISFWMKNKDFSCETRVTPAGVTRTDATVSYSSHYVGGKYFPRQQWYCARSEKLTVVLLKIQVFWDVMPCRPVNIGRRLEEM
jgi:hypothetical protein